jgi:ArsR family transcriptional regulator
MSDTELLESKAELLKALGHPTRLLILNLIRMKPRHGEELAAILNLKPATISHHLAKLTAVGVLDAEKDQYYQIFSINQDMLKPSLDEIIHLSQGEVIPNVEVDAYREKVIKTFFKHGRLPKIPAQLKKQRIVLEKIVEEFEPEREYTEKEVNIILLDFNDDVASLRRGLIEQKLMTREKGIYCRVDG